MIDLLFTTFLVAFFVLLTVKIFWPSKAERAAEQTDRPNN